MGSGILLLRKSCSMNKRIVQSLSVLPSIFTAPSSSSVSSFSSVSRNAHFVPRVRDYTSDAEDVAARRSSSLSFDRSFHSGLALRAHGFAVADYSDDDRKVESASDEGLEISKLGISNDIVSALAGKGITKLFPIQQAVLEPAMKGRDMIGRARTGTGKTLAFGIPVLDKIIRYNEKHGKGRNPLALVLAPTRELARQVDKEFYESAPSVDTLCVYGGSPIQAQMSTLDRGVDVVVGTPGRVIDLLKRGALKLSEVKFVILDEADQMLNVGFADAVETILEHIRQDHQTMMFSATMPTWILKLTQKFLKNPLHVDLVGNSDQKLADGITLYSIASETREKAGIIGPLIKEHAKGGKCIVFTQTKRDADRLSFFMSKSCKCEALHGDISQNQRERTLSGFRDGRFDILVATDVAARGLDVPNVDLVIHYELPNSSEIFVHRTGRTGRAGKKGSAILVHSSSQYRDVKGIEREAGCRFTELPKIAGEGGSMDTYGDYGNAGGRGGGGRFGGFGNSGGGRFGGSGRSGGYGGGYPSSDGYGGSNSNRSSNFGGFGSGRSAGFGNSRGSDRNSGFGKFGSSDSGRSDGFGSFNSSKSSRPSLFGDDKY